MPDAQSDPSAVQVPVLILFKPFRVSPIRLSVVPERVSAVPWGYFVSHDRSALFLDRSAQPLSQLSDVPRSAAIATINPSTLLIASNHKASHTTRHANSPAVKTNAGVSLFVADVKSLNLDIIF